MSKHTGGKKASPEPKNIIVGHTFSGWHKAAKK